MNKKLAIGLAVVGAVVVAATFATPFLALKQVADAVEARDPDQLDLIVDFAAVREGLKDQVKERAMRAGDDDPAAALAAVFVPAVVNAVVDGVVTPRGVIHLVSTGRIEGAEEAQPGGVGDAVPEFRLHKARYLGLNRFKATIGPGEASTVEVDLDRSGLFGWKVTRINLLDDPPASPPMNIPAEQVKIGDENPLLQDSAVVDPDGDGLPNAGTPYGVARTFVISRGMTPYVDDGNGRGETYPELWCKGGRFCQAAFLYRDAEGWGQYLVIETDAGGKVVREARSPYTAEGYVSIPPPLDIDIPNQLNRPYGKARKSLLAQGYLPAKAYGEEPVMACSRAIESDDFVDCEADVELPEVADCSGTGKAYCWAYWLAKDGRVLKITTIGEPQPGGVYHMEWASQEDLSDLPEGWRP